MLPYVWKDKTFTLSESLNHMYVKYYSFITLKYYQKQIV